jgi:hypothetical protein
MRAYDNRAPSPIERQAMPWTGQSEAMAGPSRLAQRAAEAMLRRRDFAAAIGGRGEARLPLGEEIVRSVSRAGGYASLAAGVVLIGWLAL